MKKIVLITGGFDPLHSGHVAYIKAAKALGDILVVGINSDAWLTRKKGAPFMPFKERAAVIRAISGVDFVIDFDDADNSAKHAIWMVRQSYPTDKIIFCNGGDRTQENIPEMATDDTNIEFVFGVGGENKTNSSSWILQEWKAPKTIRPWGYYRVLHEVPGMKVKELTIDPDGALSMQRHTGRSEFWMISEGSCIVHSQMPNGYTLPSKTLNKHDEFKVPQGEWHQLVNPFTEPCKIVEIQYGSQCTEEDIERK
jgi:cytidyltransferase-like protein